MTSRRLQRPAIAKVILTVVCVGVVTDALFGVPFANAQLPRPGVMGIGNFRTAMCTVFFWVYTFAMVFAIIMALVAAYRYMTSGGESGRVGEAHKTLIYAAVGVGVAVFARAFPYFVANLLQQGIGGNVC